MKGSFLRKFVHALLLLAIVLWMLPGNTNAAGSICHLDLGSPAPELKGYGIAGDWHQLDDYRGKWVFIDFWATWCQPCMRKLPQVVEMAQHLGQRQDFAVLSISLDKAGAEEKLLSTTERFKVSFPVVYDGNSWRSGNARGWCIDAIPATFLIDPEGRLVARDVHPEQVQEFISASDNNEYQALNISSKDSFKAGTSFTGSPAMRDLIISVDMLEGSPDVNEYLLDVHYSRTNDSGIAIQNSLKYSIEIVPQPPGSNQPYSVTIEELDIYRDSGTGLEFGDDWGLAGKPEMRLPGVVTVVDLQERTYRFEVPLPATCTSVAYSVSLYDNRIGKYISNGVRRLKVTPSKPAA